MTQINNILNYIIINNKLKQKINNTPRFVLRSEDNPGFPSDITGEVNDSEVVFSIPYGTNLSSLNPVLSIDGKIYTPEDKIYSGNSLEYIYILEGGNSSYREYSVIFTVDDTPPNVVLSISENSISEDSSGAEVTLTLSEIAGDYVEVDLLYSGTAVNGVDCSGAVSVTVLPWTLSETFILTPLQDTVSEPDKTVIIKIDTIVNGSEGSEQSVEVTTTVSSASTISSLIIMRGIIADSEPAGIIRIPSASV